MKAMVAIEDKKASSDFQRLPAAVLVWEEHQVPIRDGLWLSTYSHRRGFLASLVGATVSADT